MVILNIFKVIKNNTLRDRAVVARWAHNPEVAGSNPAPATNWRGSSVGRAILSTSLYARNLNVPLVRSQPFPQVPSVRK